MLEGMGHDLPSVYWPTVIEHITQLAARSAVGVLNRSSPRRTRRTSDEEQEL